MQLASDIQSQTKTSYHKWAEASVHLMQFLLEARPCLDIIPHYFSPYAGAEK